MHGADDCCEQQKFSSAMKLSSLVVVLFFIASHAYQILKTSEHCGRGGREYVLYGKKETKKKPTASSQPSEPQSASAPVAPRVQNNVGVSVRRQIAWAKASKRLLESTRTIGPRVAKRYNKNSPEKPAMEELISDIDYSQIKPPAVFIDGYNIIGYMNDMEGSKLDLEEARDSLISDLSVLQGATGWWMEIVFDAYKAKSPEKTVAMDSLLITFTSPKETADNYIERRFEELRKEGFTNMIVATDDRVLQSVAGSSGSGYLSASMLLEEMRIAFKGWEEYEAKLEREAQRSKPKLGDMLSKDVLDMMQQMMKK